MQTVILAILIPFLRNQSRSLLLCCYAVMLLLSHCLKHISIFIITPLCRYVQEGRKSTVLVCFVPVVFAFYFQSYSQLPAEELTRMI